MKKKTLPHLPVCRVARRHCGGGHVCPHPRRRQAPHRARGCGCDTGKLPRVQKAREASYPGCVSRACFGNMETPRLRVGPQVRCRTPTTCRSPSRAPTPPTRPPKKTPVRLPIVHTRQDVNATMHSSTAVTDTDNVGLFCNGCTVPRSRCTHRLNPGLRPLAGHAPSEPFPILLSTTASVALTVSFSLLLDGCC